jgi:hypothetical protein
MEQAHIGVLRLHEIASKDEDFDPREMHHLHLCEGCLEVFRVFRSRFNRREQELHSHGSPARREHTQ